MLECNNVICTVRPDDPSVRGMVPPWGVRINQNRYDAESREKRTGQFDSLQAVPTDSFFASLHVAIHM